MSNNLVVATTVLDIFFRTPIELLQKFSIAVSHFQYPSTPTSINIVNIASRYAEFGAQNLLSAVGENDSKFKVYNINGESTSMLLKMLDTISVS